MNDVDNILHGLGISTQSPSSTPTSEESSISAESQQEHTSGVQDSSFSNEDIDDIIEDNGIQDAIFEEEGHEEEIENNSQNENQGEGGNLEDPLYQEALNNIDPDVNEDTTTSEERLEEARENFQEALDETSTSTEENLQEDSTEEAEIPLNSPTLLIDESTSRFSGAEWYSEIQKQRIIVGGCGGIGSNLVFQLARMVPANITIYDDDTVEMVNMAGQLFSYEDIGRAKVNAMAQMISKYTSLHSVNAIKRRFTRDTMAGDVMMCGFDNMVARKVFFSSWYDHIKDKPDEEKVKCLFLDGRLSMNDLQILCIRGDDSYNINRYQCEFLFSDSEADATVCSMKQTTYLACMIGSLMTNLFTNFVANLLNPIIPYDLPFFTEYDAQNMIFKTER